MSNWIAVPQSAGVDWQISAFDGGALANVYAHVFSPWQIAKSVLHDTKGVTPTKQVRGNGTIVYSISAEFGDFEFFVQDEIITVVKFHQGNEQGTVRTTSLGRDTPMPTIPNSKRKSFTRLELSITPQLQEKITRTAEKSAELTLASLQWERKVTPRTVVRTANWTFPSGTAWWDIQRNSTGACITADSKFSPGTVRIDIANKQQPTWRWSVGGC